jgi:hypothetical protein
MSVFASFNGGIAAAGLQDTFRPTVTVRSQSGAILARSGQFPSEPTRSRPVIAQTLRSRPF